MNKHSKGEHTISAKEFPEWAARKLQLHDGAIATLLGQVKALEWGMLTMVASHPDKAALHGVWEMVRPAAVDEEMSNEPMYSTDEFRNAFQAKLADMSAWIAKGVENDRADDEDERA